MSESDVSSTGDWEVGVGNLIIDLDASIDGTKVNNMNQNGKNNVNLPTSTDNGVKLSDKGPGSTGSADPKDSIWNQNQNNKHKVKSNNNDDDKKSSKDQLDGKKSNGAGSVVDGVTSQGSSSSNKSADAKSKTKIGGVSSGKANSTTGQSNGPSSNPRQAPLTQSHGSNAQQQRETKQNTQTAQNNAQPNHLTTTSALSKAKKQQLFQKEINNKNLESQQPNTTEGLKSSAAAQAGPKENNNKNLESTQQTNAENNKISKEKLVGNLANSKQGRRESQDDATAPQKKQDKAAKEVGTITEPECLAPCDTGTEVHLSGIIWHESESGMLVVNVTWRNRSYVGTLLDASRHDWAPPRLVDGEEEQRSKRKPGRTRNLVDPGRGGRRSLRNGPEAPNNSSPQLPSRGKGKREPETNSDSDGKSAPKKPRTNGRATTPQNDPADGSSCHSPAPVSGWYNCKVADCQKKFKKLEALRYHYEDHRKKNSDEDMEVDNETGKKPKTDKTKPESSAGSTTGKTKQTAEKNAASTASTPANVDGDVNAKDAKESDGDNNKTAATTGKEESSKTLGESDAKMSVAESLLALSKPLDKEVSKLEKEGTAGVAGGTAAAAAAGGPPSLTLPRKRQEASAEKVGQNCKVGQAASQPQSMPTLIHYPKQSPPCVTPSLPPMPILTPKPGLLQSVPSPGPKRINQSSPIPDQGKISPSQQNLSSQTTDITSSPSLQPSTASGAQPHEQPPKLERRPTSPFQPVKPDPGSPNPAQQNARVSPAYSDISDAGDESIVNSNKPKGEDKDPKKEELQSSLNYYQNQYGPYDQHPNVINSFSLLNRDDKKEVGDGRKEETKSDIKSVPPQEFKAEKVDPATTSRVPSITQSSSRPKPHQVGVTEPLIKPTATIQPERRKDPEPKTPQPPKQSHPPKKDISTSSPAPKMPSSTQAAGLVGPPGQPNLINSVYPPELYNYRIPTYATPLGAYPTVPYHSVPPIVQTIYNPSIPPIVSAPYAQPMQQSQHLAKSHDKRYTSPRLGMDSKSTSHRDSRAVSPSIHPSMHQKHPSHTVHSIQQAHGLPGYPLVHPAAPYSGYGLHHPNSTKK